MDPIYKALLYLSYCDEFGRIPRKDYFSYIIRNPIYNNLKAFNNELIIKKHLRIKLEKAKNKKLKKEEQKNNNKKEN